LLVLILECSNERLYGARIADLAQCLDSYLAHILIGILECNEKRFYATGIADLSQCFHGMLTYVLIIILERGNERLNSRSTDFDALYPYVFCCPIASSYLILAWLPAELLQGHTGIETHTPIAILECGHEWLHSAGVADLAQCPDDIVAHRPP
jgi:hypothetical protein